MTAAISLRHQVEPDDRLPRGGTTARRSPLLGELSGSGRNHRAADAPADPGKPRDADITGASCDLVDTSANECTVTAPETADSPLVLGGGDVAACFSGRAAEPPLAYGVDPRADRTFAEAGKPVWGICRGNRLLNIASGGSVLDHIDDLSLHRGHGRALVIDEPIDVLPHTRLASILGAGCTSVRSAHRQAVSRLGAGSVVSARTMDVVVEAIEHETSWLVGIQLHPDLRGREHQHEPVRKGLLEATHPRLRALP